VNIDEINKPDAMVVGKVISRRWAMAWHFMLSVSGLVLTFFALKSLQQGYLFLLNSLAVVLLWFYSTRFKKSFLLGNILIAVLVAWSILIVFFSKIEFIQLIEPTSVSQLRLFRFAMLYAGFAFLSTLARELVKDIEDKEGDRRYGCRTLPIIWGVPVAKLFTAVWVSMLLLLLTAVMIYLLQLRFHGAFGYAFLFLFIPLLGWLLQLKKANCENDFSQLSRRLKWILLLGILSMIFFYF
jgi:4-hydroxybenzoate polyprenyltransferase